MNTEDRKILQILIIMLDVQPLWRACECQRIFFVTTEGQLIWRVSRLQRPFCSIIGRREEVLWGMEVNVAYAIKIFEKIMKGRADYWPNTGTIFLTKERFKEKKGLWTKRLSKVRMIFLGGGNKMQKWAGLTASCNPDSQLTNSRSRRSITVRFEPFSLSVKIN